MNLQLPNGYTARPAQREDALRVCGLWNARSLWAQYGGEHSETTQLKNWDDPRFNLETDSLVVFDSQSTLVGYAHIRDVKEPPVDVFCTTGIHPSHDDQTWLWETLLQWAEAEARRVIAKAPTDALIALLAGGSDEDTSKLGRLQDFGF
ncbi:hypothetical protein KAR02_09280, partial [Candidatus Bipolaricaulota bacterium]|nr:hypothetical protein [Candidatus Bipolaricaulota bacterium]